MIRETLSAIEGIGIYPLVGLVLFVLVFLVVLIRTIRMDRDLVQKLAQMPLDENRPQREEGDSHG